MTFGHHLLLVGRHRQTHLSQAFDEYAQRLEHYADLQVTRPKDEEKLVRALEGQKGETRTVVLDERGPERTTEELARQVEKWRDGGIATVRWVIGPADGLSTTLRGKFETLRLSRFTLPHQLAHVMLAEQLYRAHTFLKGEPYHRG